MNFTGVTATIVIQHEWDFSGSGAGPDGVQEKLRAPRKVRFPDQFLADNDSYHFFEKTGGLVKTGPTGTNVADVRILLV